jgi:hypothetical protein
MTMTFEASAEEESEKVEKNQNQLEPDETSVFYYAKCPHCSMKFAVSNMLKITCAGFDGEEEVRAAEENDTIDIYCPLCGQCFPLVVAEASKTLLTNMT